MIVRSRDCPQQRIARVFDELDIDGDGTIPLNEIRHLLSENRRQVELNDGQIMALLNVADKNHDDVLDLAEFSLLITSAQAQKNRTKRMLYSVADSVIAKSERPIVHSYIDQYNCLPPPLFVILISLSQVLTFVVYYISGKHDDVMNSCAGCFFGIEPGPLLFAPTLRHQAWRFVTYQFLHKGLMHLLPNVLFQLIVGIPLELVHKIWRIAPIYLLAVCFGALLQYCLDPTVYLIGCSAGVYALVTAHLSNVIINWGEMPYRLLRLVVVLTYIIFDVGAAIYRRLLVGDCDKISYMAHIAGAITGFLVGVVLLQNLQILKWERILMFVCLGVYVIIVIVTIVVAIFIAPDDRHLWGVSQCYQDS